MNIFRRNLALACSLSLLLLRPASAVHAAPNTSNQTPSGSCAGVGGCGSDGSNCTVEWPKDDCKDATGTYLETCQGYAWCKNKQTGSSEGGVKKLAIAV